MAGGRPVYQRVQTSTDAQVRAKIEDGKDLSRMIFDSNAE